MVVSEKEVNKNESGVNKLLTKMKMEPHYRFKLSDVCQQSWSLL